MTIPVASDFPDEIDTNVNLFLAHDALRVQLVEDYNPGDISITVSGEAMGRFPITGFITLTEQCSEGVARAINFYYGSRTLTTFDELELAEGFPDVVKPKFFTNVTQNVVAEHHNSLKDALIAIQEFLGVKGTVDLKPLGDTMEGRINFLRRLVLRPRAWFAVNKRIGVVPLKIKFTDLSFRNPTEFIWDFGDNTSSSVTLVSATTEAPNIPNIIVTDLDGKDIEKTYHSPNIYSVSLTVSNEFGSDTVILPDLINARIAAPNEATISVDAQANQTITDIDPDEEPYLYAHLLPGILNARTNSAIEMSIVDDGEQSGDPIIHYEWKLNDDLNHADANTTKASYSVGGMYDIVIRVDSTFGSYRITTIEEALNIVEHENLFLINFDADSVETAITKNASAYEFGLISETFKTKNRSVVPITKDYRFLDTGIPEYARQKREFLRNQNMGRRGTVFSGDNGTAVVYWAEGGAAGSLPSSQKIRFMEYEGFTDTWRTPSSFTVNRNWNWIGLNSSAATHILLGNINSTPSAGTSPVNQDRVILEYVGLTTSTVGYTESDYKNGADELINNVGEGDDGHFSVYRSCFKDNNGYIVRNDGVGVYFRLKSFYRTEGTLTDPVQNIRKLTDMPGSARMEGQLVAMTNGVYFFNNSGEIAVYDTVGNVWAVGGPGINSVSFRSLQDSSVAGFDSQLNTLVATSDGDRRTYLSYDYSIKAFIKFTESDLSFVSLPSRPAGTQFIAGVF